MPRKEENDRVSINKSSKAITLVLIGPSLMLGGCNRPQPVAQTPGPGVAAGQQPGATVRCPKCGQMNVAGASICAKCGASLRSATSSRSSSGYRGGGFYGGVGRSGGSSPGVSSSPSPGGGFGSTGGRASAGA